MVMAEPTKGPVFIAGDKPVTEDQVRQKLQSDGWSNIEMARDALLDGKAGFVMK
jgi:hypothetical protein